MDATPIECEARGLRDRHVHVLRSLARLLAVAGFALAGWIALASLNGAAMADDGTSRSGAPHDLVGSAAADRSRPSAPSGPSTRNESSLATLRHLKVRWNWSPRETTEVVTGDVRDVRERPAGYLRERGRDIVRDGDTAVRALRELGDATGVQNVRERGDEPGRQFLGKLVGGVRDASPVPVKVPVPVRLPKGDAPDGTVQDGTASGSGSGGQGGSKTPQHAAKGVHVGDGKVVPAQFAGSVSPDDLPDPDTCTTCRGGHDPLDTPPLLPGQDSPRSGSSVGGHPFGPLTDLATAADPAAPLGMDLRAFRRTSLTDIAAPGRPAVVPD
ncbi:hypothetical protein BJF79_43725 [Actinomadura sp. CNU-125]|uniref:hypothetical protein n=1 Tax=Actinomadura sp. CNU-125 TaxID=1904961 RepID=UPI00095B05C5|nr:hypothetical protein [Actinomadura sp. CNU-125]OLT26288.1 hypothetical protein BJF79_43725 [Actinomadura sp. CNU-125]